MSLKESVSPIFSITEKSKKLTCTLWKCRLSPPWCSSECRRWPGWAGWSRTGPTTFSGRSSWLQLRQIWRPATCTSGTEPRGTRRFQSPRTSEWKNEKLWGPDWHSYVVPGNISKVIIWGLSCGNGPNDMADIPYFLSGNPIQLEFWALSPVFPRGKLNVGLSVA